MIKENETYENTFTGARVVIKSVQASSHVCGQSVSYDKGVLFKDSLRHFTKPLDVFEQSYDRVGLAFGLKNK